VIGWLDFVPGSEFEFAGAFIEARSLGAGGDRRREGFSVAGLAHGAQLDDELRGRITRRIREDRSPRHVPNDVFAIDEIPRTITGKLLEVPVKRILLGAPAETALSRGSLTNPRALEYFIALAASRADTGNRRPACLDRPRVVQEVLDPRR
jgi:acetoacetyl-CoA synthetase